MVSETLRIVKLSHSSLSVDLAPSEFSFLCQKEWGGCSQLKQLRYKTGRFSPYQRMVIGIYCR